MSVGSHDVAKEVHRYAEGCGTSVPEIRAVIADGFAEDSLLRWVFPDPETRLDATAAWMGLFADIYARVGTMDFIRDADGVAGVALWRLPEHGELPRPDRPSIPGLAAAIVGGTRAAVLFSGLAALGTLKPEAEGSYAYLHVLAVSPSRQRQGLGRRLVSHVIDEAASRGLAVALETMNPDNLAFYGSLGFTVTKQITLQPDGPTTWALWRPGP